MNHCLQILIAPLCFFVAAGAALAQPAVPMEGQPGKDVVWIASPRDMVEKMLDMAQVTPADLVIDLGSGDGRNVIAAAKRGARALGVEYDAPLVEVARRAAAGAGVAGRATFMQGDMFEADISGASVLILFLIPENLRKLEAKFRALKPGTRIVSNTYEIPGWYGEETGRTIPCLTWCVATLYVVPPGVAGVWRLPDAELTLEQDLQVVFGSYETSGLSVRVEGGRLHGNEIRFSVNGVEYSGRVEGNTMTGTARGRTTHAWTATRAP
ncbi:MAG: methyltransferase [Betaproteobacteria bacterium]|nr:methyltransferase [Betaproteobacteria bacterium]